MKHTWGTHAGTANTKPSTEEAVVYCSPPLSTQPQTPSSESSRLVDALRDEFPYGHASFIPLVLEQVKLHSDKNHDYARGGNPLGNFTRVAAILAAYPGFPYATSEGVAFIYALKQLDAEAWSMCQGGVCKVEGLKGRTDDQAVYANLRACMRAERRPQREDGHPTLGPRVKPVTS